METKVLEKHFRVPIVKFGVPSANKRIYSADMVPKLQELCETKRFCGIPAEPSFNTPDVPLDKIGAAIETIEVIDNVVYADILLLDTPSGHILQDLRQTGELGARLFGMGKIDENGIVFEFKPLGLHIGLEKDMAAF